MTQGFNPEEYDEVVGTEVLELFLVFRGGMC